MSKRFGRNQKRKMREEISRLEIQSRDATNKSHNLESRLITWARSMRSYLGPNHPLNEHIEQILLNSSPSVYDRFRFMAPVKLSTILDKSLSDISIAQEYITTVLHVVGLRKDEIAPSVIAELISSDKQCYYAIDERQLKAGRQDPRFIKWLSVELAHKLSEHIANV